MFKSFTILVLLLAPTLLAGEPEVFQKRGKAIKGYDTVAYHTEGRPTPGDPRFAHTYKGAAWLFASAENLAKFKAEPEKYAPQFGGYCAYAVANGGTAKIEPDAWKIVDGKLYLNYDKGIQKKWEKDIPGYIKKAEANWPKVLD